MPPTVIQHRGRPLLIFESEPDYLANNAAAGYWGPVASSIDWCEQNYVVTFWVAEFFNTISNAAFFCLGVWGVFIALRHRLEHRFVICHAGIALIGAGSAMFHGTLTHIGQQGDETPMVVATINWLLTLYFMDPAREARSAGIHRRCAWICAVLCLFWSGLHWHYRFTVAFQAMIATLLTGGVVLISREWPKCTEPSVLALGRFWYLFTAGAAFLLWLCDQHFCDMLHALPSGVRNPQFHAWWHILMGINGYIGPTFLSYQRLVYLGKSPQLRYTLCGLLPYVDSRHQDKSG